MSLLSDLNTTNPKRKLMLFPMKPLPPEYILHFVVDPVNESRDISVRNMWELTAAPGKLTD